ncbi:MAG: patatin-like phospholipase family protein [Candidatus Eremiobacteraeota bacterium]|nr:patatin-like phospholipase family protein [Candidatus Eremiobacteraeota bacterium]MCW5866833.1 patatin-like phospholipase family protein [Candidatus Eremiobacteraeota bacterium]
MIDATRITSTTPPVVPAAPARSLPASEPAAPQPQDQFAATGAPATETRPTLAPPPVQVAPPPAVTVEANKTISAPVPNALYCEPSSPPPPPPGGPLLPPGDLGRGFPSAGGESHSMAERLHGFLAKDPTGLYDVAVNKILHRVSDVTEKGIGIDVSGLLSVERTLYTTLAGGIENYTGGTPPLFMALAEGQAAYVNLGPKRKDEADHLMRMFAGLPLDVIEGLPADDGDSGKVRRILLEKAKSKEFPVYVDVDGNCAELTATESIATESIASIARRENNLGADFPDPRMYYKWLVKRVDSNYRRLDPWLFGVKQPLHDKISGMKEKLSPPWAREQNLNDPFGATPSSRGVKKAYATMMEICGNGQPPTWSTLTDIADAAIGMDRDLLSGIQTFWIKLLSEVSREQRESLMLPLSRAWVNLNVLGPESPQFDLVSPPNAPYIEMIDRHSGKEISERYDRSLAIGQAVDHTIAGLGIQERRNFLEVLMKDIRAHQPELEAREQRLRARLGDKYHGLDIDAILNDRADINTPGVRESLKELVEAAQPGRTTHEMTPEYAEIVRHRDMLDWVASRFARYGDQGVAELASHDSLEDISSNPLILGEFYTPKPRGTPVTPMPDGPSRQDILGQPIPGKRPVKTSFVLEGGGGKGLAFVEALKQTREALSQGQGQVAIDEYVGNSAGALTAGLLAAGYDGDELAEVLKQLDFKKFYSDYLWLSGGVDPKVRGINRTGLFSQQKMYNVLSELLQQKVPVEGRPVLFRDLPFKLKVTSTMINADLPPEVRERLNIQPDGQVCFSNETTPNMDVAAALCCSAAVPGFFNAPQLQVCNDGDSQNPVLHRMQMVDGGVVNNFPVSEVSKDEKSFLLALPAYSEAPNPNGGAPIALTTLNFDSANIGVVNEYNKKRYAEFKPQLANLIQTAADSGYGRAVIGLNLTNMGTQTAPIVQGHDRCETNELLGKARQLGLPAMSAEAGAGVIKGNLQAKNHGFLEQNLLNTLLDKDDHFKPKGPFGGSPKYRPGKEEACGIPDMLACVMGAAMTAPAQIEQRVFERD